MDSTPKGLRLHIGLFGRTNVGKSSFLNLIAGQDVAITSTVPGTTTDVVEKTMELLPVGPVVILDTAGLDDTSVLAEERMKKTRRIFDRADVIVLVIEPGVWTSFEDTVIAEAKQRSKETLVVINKIDLAESSAAFVEQVRARSKQVVQCSSISGSRGRVPRPGVFSDQGGVTPPVRTGIDDRDRYVNAFKQALIDLCPDDFLTPPPLIGDLVKPGGLAILIVPIDLEAPKGRLILPQVQTIRDALDNDAAALVVKEREYAHVLRTIGVKPDIVVCDSQVVLKMVADTPQDIPCTTFSMLFARFKGELIESVRGVAAIERLQPGDKILIAEACSHHALEDDIGRVKIPRWIRQFVGGDIQADVYAGRDYPDNLAEYKAVVHCGACMLTRREMLMRTVKARQAGVAITNYGVCISYVQGVLERVLSPFPAALSVFKEKNRP